jgi:PAS domain S-box-containing protein
MNQHPLDTEIKDWHIQHLPYKIMWMDKEGNIVYANDQFKDLLEYKSSELLKLNIFDINPSATSETWSKHWEEVEQNGSSHFKSVHQTKSGKYYDVEVFAQFFSNNGKKLICATVNDISQSRFYRNLLDHSERMTNSGGWKLNLQDGSIIVTEQLFTIFETEEKSDFLPGKIIHRFYESEELKQLIGNAIRKGIPYDKILTLQMPDFSVKYIRCIADPIIKRDKIYKLIGTYQDVSCEVIEQKKLSTFKSIIDNAQDLIYFRDQDHNFKYVNEAFLDYVRTTLPQFSDITYQKAIKKNEHDFWPNRSNQDMDTLWELVQQEGTVNKNIEYQSDDKTLYFQSTVLKITYNDENLTCGITRDVTDIKENEINLRTALDELSELKNELELDNQYLKEEINERVNIDNIICQSEAYREVLEKVTQVAVTDATVLITGESGTGKELLATAVHLNSRRNERALIKVNCATLPKDLIESELFGHKRGAFTGAIADKVGKFSLADGGTIFLDEIGEIPIELQSKLLRVLQEGEFDALGATKTSKVDVRVIAATNRNLLEMVNEGKFREDLYYRLNVFPIYNIPLRARKEDIPLLADFFLKKYSVKAGKSFKRLSKQTIKALMEYNFPGNIRELENLIERAVIIENGTTLKPGNWLPKVEGLIQSDEFKSLDEMQRNYIIDVLEHTKWRVSGPKGAATILGMKDKTLFARMKKLGIEKQVGLKK